MGKSEGFLTPKAISKRIKAKGLQRLRWYCQLCQKQCRDENGFKCHTESESHQRMMLLFADAPGRFVGQYSTEFRNAFLDVLKHRFGTKKVHANVVYNEYIKDKDHIHMNATRWATLTGFVAYLGREGYCEVEETEKGLFICYIDKQAAERYQRAREIEKEREQLIEKQRQEALKREGNSTKEVDPKQYEYHPSNEKLRLSFKPTSGRLIISTSQRQVTEADSKPNVVPDTSEKSVMEQASSVFEQVSGEYSWLSVGLVVRILNAELEDGLYLRRKAVVKEVVEPYVADVEVIGSEDLVRIDQADLEPVIPQPGGKYMSLRR
eukprot:jgi/Galph1/5893/GphlegSOOS_G4479.1